MDPIYIQAPLMNKILGIKDDHASWLIHSLHSYSWYCHFCDIRHYLALLLLALWWQVPLPTNDRVAKFELQLYCVVVCVAMKFTMCIKGSHNSFPKLGETWKFTEIGNIPCARTCHITNIPEFSSSLHIQEWTVISPIVFKIVYNIELLRYG